MGAYHKPTFVPGAVCFIKTDMYYLSILRRRLSRRCLFSAVLITGVERVPVEVMQSADHHQWVTVRTSASGTHVLSGAFLEKHVLTRGRGVYTDEAGQTVDRRRAKRLLRKLATQRQQSIVRVMPDWW